MTYLPETRQQLLAAAERRAGQPSLPLPRLRLGWVVPALSLAVAVAVTIAFLGLRPQPRRQPAAAPSMHQIALTYVAQPTPQVPVITRAALMLTVKGMNLRLSEIPHSRSSIKILSGHRISVQVRTRMSRYLVDKLVGSSAQLLLFDWEANALLPNGRVATTQPQRPPRPLDLYQAVRLAARQPRDDAGNSREGSEYFVFSHSHRLLMGPLDALPRSRPHRAQVLQVKQGTVVLEAERPFRVAEQFGDPGATYYVLRDRVSVFGNQISDPRAGTIQSGAPDVTFRFRGNGAIAFHELTAELARRGELESSAGRNLYVYQHFAVALDDRLIILLPVDFRQYPDGMVGSKVQLTGTLSKVSARGLARALQLGTLPVKLKLVGNH